MWETKAAHSAMGGWRTWWNERGKTTGKSVGNFSKKRVNGKGEGVEEGEGELFRMQNMLCDTRAGDGT